MDGCCTKRERVDTLSSDAYFYVDTTILNCIKRLEKEEQLLSAYIFDDLKHPQDFEVEILRFMNSNLTEIFKCPLQVLKDKDIAIVAIHAFYRSDNLKEEWSKCTFHLFTGLLACYILRKMQNIFDDMNEYELAELYKKAKDGFEEEVSNLLDDGYRRNVWKMRKALKTNYTRVIEMQYSYASACWDRSLLDLAMIAKCEKFLNHSMCRRISNERWTPRISVSSLRFVISFCTLLPILFIRFERHANDPEKEETKVSCGAKIIQRIKNIPSSIPVHARNIKDFYLSPCSNFCFHTIFYLMYIILYAAVLLNRGRNEIRFSEQSDFVAIFYKEILLFIWQISFIADMVVAWFTVGHTKFKQDNPADYYHNFFNIAWITLVPVSTVFHDFDILPWMWGILVIVRKFFYHLSFIFSSVRIMRVFAADSFFGVIVIMMKKMVKTLWSFFIVFILFWTTYAVAVVSLLEEPPTIHTFAWSIFSNGAFEIFGEMKDEVKTGEVEGCPLVFNNSTIIKDYTVDCFFRTWMLPILLFIYVLVSSVLLVNLVTSFFTNTFEQVRDASMLQYGYKSNRGLYYRHYQRLVEFETKVHVPPPLSLLYYAIWALIALFKFCYRQICECRKQVLKRKSREIRPNAPEQEPLNQTVSIVMEADTGTQSTVWRGMSDGERMAEIIGFIQRSMRTAQTVEREESVDHQSQILDGVITRERRTSTVRSYADHWIRRATGSATPHESYHPSGISTAASEAGSEPYQSASESFNHRRSSSSI